MLGSLITISVIFSLNILLLFENVVYCAFPTVVNATSPGGKTEMPKNASLPLQVIVKEVIENERPLITTSSNDFINFVRRSDVMVDKTGIIKYLLDNYNESIILITCPCGMGKTLNLNSLASFLSIEVDENGEKIAREKTSNYLLFAKGEVQSEDLKSMQKLKHPLLISKNDDLIANYLGRYPVIKISLGEMRGNTFKNILNGFKIALSQAFEAHKYILKIFDKKMTDRKYNLDTEMQKDFFMKILEGKEEDENKLFQAISFLSKILYNNFKNFVYLFVDDYDVGFNEMFLNPKISDGHRKKFMKFFKTFVHSGTKNNPYLASAYFTGVIEIEDDTFRQSSYDCRGNEFHQYYGISEEAITELFEATNIPINQRTELVKWYGGYRFGRNKNIRVFNPQSIANFINSRKFHCYWTESPAIDNFLKTALKNPSFRVSVNDLVYNNSVILLLTPNDLKFGEEHYLRFREFVSQIVKSSNSYVPRLVLQYLYLSGYLEIHNYYHSFFGLAHTLKFTNLEITTAMSRKVELFYNDTLEPQGNLSSAYSIMQTEFASFLFDYNISSLQLAEGFKNYLKSLPKFVKKITTSDVDFVNVSLEYEMALRFLVEFLTFKLKHSELGSTVIMKRINSIHHSDLLMFSKSKITIVQFNVKTNQIEHEIAYYQKYTRNFNEMVTAIKYISITPNQDKKVRVEAVIKTL